MLVVAQMILQLHKIKKDKIYSINNMGTIVNIKSNLEMNEKCFINKRPLKSE